MFAFAVIPAILLVVSTPGDAGRLYADPGVREVRSAIHDGELYRVILGTRDRNAYIAFERISLIDDRVVARARWNELPVGDTRLPAISVTSIESITVDSERLMRVGLATERRPVTCSLVITNQSFQPPQCSHNSDRSSAGRGD